MMVKILALVSGCCVAVELDCTELQFPAVLEFQFGLLLDVSLLQKPEKEDLLWFLFVLYGVRW
jgi:hypothetical protein